MPCDYIAFSVANIIKRDGFRLRSSAPTALSNEAGEEQEEPPLATGRRRKLDKAMTGRR